MSPAQEMVYRFLELPYVCRMDLMQSLGLAGYSDSNLPDNDRYTLYFRRASERGLVEELRARIKSAYEEWNPSPPSTPASTGPMQKEFETWAVWIDHHPDNHAKYGPGSWANEFGIPGEPPEFFRSKAEALKEINGSPGRTPVLIGVSPARLATAEAQRDAEKTRADEAIRELAGALRQVFADLDEHVPHEYHLAHRDAHAVLAKYTPVTSEEGGQK